MSFIKTRVLKMYSSICMDEGIKNGMGMLEVFGESEGGAVVREDISPCGTVSSV